MKCSFIQGTKGFHLRVPLRWRLGFGSLGLLVEAIKSEHVVTVIPIIYHYHVDS